MRSLQWLLIPKSSAAISGLYDIEIPLSSKAMSLNAKTYVCFPKWYSAQIESWYQIIYTRKCTLKCCLQWWTCLFDHLYVCILLKHCWSRTTLQYFHCHYKKNCNTINSATTPLCSSLTGILHIWKTPGLFLLSSIKQPLVLFTYNFCNFYIWGREWMPLFPVCFLPGKYLHHDAF